MNKLFIVYRIYNQQDNTAQKMKFSTTDFFSKCDQIRTFLRIWSHLLKKSVSTSFFVQCNSYWTIPEFDV